MYRETIQSSQLLRYALPAAAAFTAADFAYGLYRGLIKINLALIVFALIVALLWLATQFAALEAAIDDDALTLSFGRFKKIVARKDVLEVWPARLTFWNAGGLGIRRGLRGEAWVAKLGPAVALRLKNRRRLTFSAARPEFFLAEWNQK